MNQGIIKLGKLEVDLEELAKFIAKAKRHCYAGNGKEERAEDGSKVLTFQEGDFHYTDNYDGFYQAQGSEIVRWQKSNGQRIWQMSYSGGVLPEFWEDEKLAKQIFTFLKEALLTVESKAPFRGKEAEIIRKIIGDNRLSYQCYTKGDIKNFSGRENIWTTEQDGEVFAQKYLGELIIPK